MASFGDIGEGIGSLAGGIALLTGAAGEGGMDDLNEIVRIMRKIELPEFDFTDLDPQELVIVAEYFPNIYEAMVPPEVKLAADSPELRSAQMRGLAQIERVAAEGLPLEDRLATEDIGRRLARESGRTQGNILENLRARGRAGGGTELQARMAGSQQTSDLLGQYGSDVARSSLMRRLQAAADTGSLAGSIRGQDIRLNESNADRINRYNAFVSSMMTQAAADAAASRERAQFANVSTRQGIADENVRNRQAMDIWNRQREDTLKQRTFDNEMSRASGLTSALAGRAQGAYAEQAATAGAIRDIGGGGGRAYGGVLDYMEPDAFTPEDELRRREALTKWYERYYGGA